MGGPSISPGRPWLSRSWRMGPGDFRSPTFLSVSPDLLPKTDIPASPSWIRNAVAKALSERRAIKDFGRSVEFGHNDHGSAHRSHRQGFETRMVFQSHRPVHHGNGNFDRGDRVSRRSRLSR